VLGSVNHCGHFATIVRSQELTVSADEKLRRYVPYLNHRGAQASERRSDPERKIRREHHVSGRYIFDADGRTLDCVQIFPCVVLLSVETPPPHSILASLVTKRAFPRDLI
jgi:hypothetical protein